MGLVVMAYTGLEEIGVSSNYKVAWTPDIEWTERYYEGMTDGLEDKTYKWETKSRFEIGSYRDYNQWKEQLEKFASSVGYGRFLELIDFPDNEGVIGPYAVQKLVNDFEHAEYEAIEYSKEITYGDRWLERYQMFLTAFQIASKEGAIEFQ